MLQDTSSIRPTSAQRFRLCTASGNRASSPNPSARCAMPARAGGKLNSSSNLTWRLPQGLLNHRPEL
ncbi:unnamed protein product [Urochloa humidicola]